MRCACGLEHLCNQCGKTRRGDGRTPCARPATAGSRPVGLLEMSTVADPPLDRLGRPSICWGLDLLGRSSRSWGDRSGGRRVCGVGCEEV
eukprot:4373450-Prymnesium_polylepis.1